MRHNLKNISLILLVILAIGLLAGCTPKEPSKNEVLIEDLTLATGYAKSLVEKDGMNFVVIEVEGEDLELELEDEDLFASLEENEFYIFAYNKDRIARSIKRDHYLKNLVENGMDGDSFIQEIVADEIISLDGLTLLDEYIIDFNSDSYDEKIAMYVAAGLDDNGEIMWDDGQRWVLVVHGDNKDYVLYDDYVQLGSIQFNVFTADDDFNIVTKSIGTASLDISQYKYDEANDSFIQTVPYSANGNVNMLYNSN